MFIFYSLDISSLIQELGKKTKTLLTLEWQQAKGDELASNPAPAIERIHQATATMVENVNSEGQIQLRLAKHERLCRERIRAAEIQVKIIDFNNDAKWLSLYSGYQCTQSALHLLPL